MRTATVLAGAVAALAAEKARTPPADSEAVVKALRVIFMSGILTKRFLRG
jgi:hypothetical protein